MKPHVYHYLLSVFLIVPSSLLLVWALFGYTLGLYLFIDLVWIAFCSFMIIVSEIVKSKKSEAPSSTFTTDFWRLTLGILLVVCTWIIVIARAWPTLVWTETVTANTIVFIIYCSIKFLVPKINAWLRIRRIDPVIPIADKETPNPEQSKKSLAIALKLQGKLGPAIETWQFIAENGNDCKSRLEAIGEINKLERLRGQLTRELHSTIKISELPTFREYARKSLAVFADYPPVFFIHDYAGYKSLISSLENEYPEGKFELASAMLTFAELLVQNSDHASSSELARRAWEWTIAHDEKEIRCWCSLMQAKIAISASRCEKPESSSAPCNLSKSISENGPSELLQDAMVSISGGLKTARDCGYSLYNIDLYLARARLHLFGGDSQSALEDIRIALDDGLPSDERTGQPELLAANHPECGYVWAIAEGLQLRGEALLLQAAQELGSNTFVDQNMIDMAHKSLPKLWQVERELAEAVKARESSQYTHETIESMVFDRGKLALDALNNVPGRIARIASDNFDSISKFLSLQINGQNVVFRHPEYLKHLKQLQRAIDAIKDWKSTITSDRATYIDAIIAEGRHNLDLALRHWQPLHDPEPERPDQNFQLDGKQYNYRAAETYRVLKDLEGGALTNYPLKQCFVPQNEVEKKMNDRKRKVFVSHSTIDKPFVERIVKELESRKVRVWFDKNELSVGDSVVQGISQGLAEADYLLLILSPNSVKSNWVQTELNAAIMEETSKKGLVVLPALIEDCTVPFLLRDRIYADFRTDFEIGLTGLLRVLNQESATAQSSEPSHRIAFERSDCQASLSSLSLAELRRRISKRMARHEIGTVWFDVLETSMDNDMQGRFLPECIIELLDRAKNRNKLAEVIASICSDRSDLGNP